MEFMSFWKRFLRAPLPLPHCEDRVICEPGADRHLQTRKQSPSDGESVDALILDISASGTVENKFLLFINQPICAFLLQRSTWTQTLPVLLSAGVPVSPCLPLHSSVGFRSKLI